MSSWRLIFSQLITSRRLIVSQLITSRRLIVSQLITSRRLIVSQLITSRRLIVSQLIINRRLIVNQQAHSPTFCTLMAFWDRWYVGKERSRKRNSWPGRRRRQRTSASVKPWQRRRREGVSMVHTGVLAAPIVLFRDKPLEVD